MKRKKYSLLLAILSFLPLEMHSTCGGVPQTWTGATDQTWNTTTNWSGSCIPGIGAITDTETVTFATPGPGGGSISLDVVSGVGLGSLTFNNGSTSYTISPSPAGRFIQFNGASSTLSVLAGSHTITSPINVNNTTLNISIANGSTLTFQGLLSEAVGSTSSILFDGAGQWTNDPTVAGQGISIAGLITQSNGTMLNKHTTPSAALGSLLQATQGITIQGGLFTQTNSGAITATGTGCVSSSLSGTFTLTSGSVSNANSGTVTSNTGGVGIVLRYNGGFLIQGGTLSNTNSNTISGTNAIGVAISSSGTFTMNGGTISCINTGACNGGALGIIFNSATHTMSGGDLTFLNQAPVSSSFGNVYFTTNYNMSGGTFTLSNSGDISGTLGVGSILSATGSIVLSGGTLTNTANTGSISGVGSAGSLIQSFTSISIDGGTLLNDDTVRAPILTIGTNGNLAGKGFFNDTALSNTIAVTNGGTLTPGNAGVGAASPGTMTISGGYTQSASGKLIVNILNGSTFSQLDINGTPGTATLSGALEVGLSPGSAILPGDIYTIVQTTQGVIGTFSQLISSTPGFIPSLTYLANAVQLSFLINPEQSSSSLSLQNFLNRFTEPLLSSINETNIRLERQMARLRSRFSRSTQNKETAFTNPSDLSFVAARNNFNVKPIQQRANLPWDVYFGPTGNFGTVDSEGTQIGFDYWSSGVLAGFDYAFSQAGVGFLTNYDHIVGHKKEAGKFTIDELHGSVYSTYAPIPDLALNAVIGGSYEWYQMRRVTGLGSHDALGSPQGGECDALLGVEYTFSHRKFLKIPKRLEITPLASLQYIYLHVGGYTEEEASTFDLRVKEQTVQSLRSTLGARLNYTWLKDICTPSLFPNLTVAIDLAWQREFLDHNRSIGFAPIAFVQPSSTLIVPGSGRNFVLAGIDLFAKTSERYGFEASYDFEWNTVFIDHSFYLGLDIRF